MTTILLLVRLANHHDALDPEVCLATQFNQPNIITLGCSLVIRNHSRNRWTLQAPSCTGTYTLDNNSYINLYIRSAFIPMFDPNHVI